MNWVHALRLTIESEALNSFAGAREQQALYEDHDFGGWFPPENDQYYGQFAKAANKSKAAWSKKAKELALSSDYAEMVRDYGLALVLQRIHGWYETPAEIETTVVACKAAAKAAKAKAEAEKAAKAEKAALKAAQAETVEVLTATSKIDRDVVAQVRSYSDLAWEMENFPKARLFRRTESVGGFNYVNGDGESEWVDQGYNTCEVSWIIHPALKRGTSAEQAEVNAQLRAELTSLKAEKAARDEKEERESILSSVRKHHSTALCLASFGSNAKLVENIRCALTKAQNIRMETLRKPKAQPLKAEKVSGTLVAEVKSSGFSTGGWDALDKLKL